MDWSGQNPFAKRVRFYSGVYLPCKFHQFYLSVQTVIKIRRYNSNINVAILAGIIFRIRTEKYHFFIVERVSYF